MNNRIRNKKAKSKKSESKINVIDAWNIIAEDLAKNGGLTFFINPNWMGDRLSYILYNAEHTYGLISKAVRHD